MPGLQLKEEREARHTNLLQEEQVPKKEVAFIIKP
jgi:hypothetical protein